MKSIVMISQVPWQGVDEDVYESDGSGESFFAILAVIAFFSFLGWLNRRPRN